MNLNPRFFAVAGVMCLALAACGKKDDAAGGGMGAAGAMPPPEVGVIEVRPGAVTLEKELVGRLAPYRSADVRARVPGVVQRRVYQEGSDVRQGDVLFVIDPTQLQAEAGIAKAALAQAQATAANARAAAARARQLAPGQFISKSDLDAALAAERTAAAAVQQAQAALRTSNINLGYATVRAPIAGRAGKAQVTEGALVGQGTPTLLTTIDQIDPLYVNFSMGVGELEQVRGLQASGQTRVRIVLPDGTEYAHAGVLDFSGDVVDPATGAVTLRARLPNPGHRLLPGTYVTLKAAMGQLGDAVLIPQAAVQRDAQSAYVMLVGPDGKVARRDVVAETAQGANWIVTKGLSGGEKVIVSGLQKVQPGQPAKATPWQAPGGQPASAAAPAAKQG